jgi:hypothetical protein
MADDAYVAIVTLRVAERCRARMTPRDQLSEEICAAAGAIRSVPGLTGSRLDCELWL